jgi:uroporphyrinogen III methyltransferase/synthase
MKAKLAAVGPKTAAALEEKGLLVQVLPGEFRAEGLLNSLADQMKPGEKVLLPRADIARETLPRELRERGMAVTEADTYETVIDAENAAETIELLKRKAIHIVTFTSSSTVKNFVQALASEHVPELLDGVQVACIGPITAETAKALGITPDIVAQDYSIQGLLDALLSSGSRAAQR